jgi:hypothetical protein
MRTIRRAAFSTIAVVAKNLQIIRKLMPNNPLVEHDASTMLACLASLCPVVVLMVHGQEIKTTFTAACALPAISINHNAFELVTVHTLSKFATFLNSFRIPLVMKA